MKIFLWGLYAAGLIMAFVCWLIDKDGCNVMLSFEMFHIFWKKDPDNWILQPGWAHYFSDNGKRIVEYSVCFSFIGWLKYRLWKIFREKIERDEMQRKIRMEFEKFMEAEDGT